MKKILLAFVIISAPSLLLAQSVSIRHMFRSYDPGKEVRRIHIPSCVTTIASWFADDPDARFFLKNIGSVYILASEDESFAAESNFPTLIAKKLKNRNFEEMMSVNSSTDKINILARTKKRNRSEFVIAVDGEEDAVVYIRSKLELAELLSRSEFGMDDLHLDKVVKKI